MGRLPDLDKRNRKNETMPLSKEQKDRIIKKYRVHDTDTGSAEVQIAILTEEIKQLTVHMKEHKHDYSSRLGLIKKVQERKKLMDYLKRENQESFVDLARELKLKIALQREKEKAEQKELKDNE